MLLQRPHPNDAATRLARRRWIAAACDVLIVAVFVVGALAEAFVGIDQVWPGRSSNLVTALCAIAAPLPLLARRRHPFGVVVAVAVIIVAGPTLLHAPIGLLSGLGPLLVGLYSAARYARRPYDYAALAAPAFVMVAFSFTLPGFVSLDEFLPDIVGFGLVFGAGQLVRRWLGSKVILRESVDALEASERSRTESAVLDERARIARELHDIVAHCVSLMVVQAGSARKQLVADPAASEVSLRAVEDTGREALVEMRRMLGVLTATEPGGLEPQPSLTALEPLLERFRTAGLAVELTRGGGGTAVPPGVDVCAYRLVQEGLTNALNHGTGERAAVRLRYLPDALELEVVNPVGPGRGRGGGHGLIGMRERARLFGGSLEAGRLPGGDFRITARLPWSAP